MILEKKIIKQYLSLALISFFVFGCVKENPLPLEEKKLIKILCDIHLAEAALAKLNGSIKDSAAVKLYQQIYTIHEVSEAELDSCLYRIKRDPEIMQDIYQQVMTELDKMKLEDQPGQ
ncbi:MAG: DUF4296 domain-containing protein [Bacteroidota bacterium]